MIEGFEYASDADLQAAGWYPQGATIGLSTWVASGTTGTNSLRVERLFLSEAWATEVITGPVLSTPLVIDPAKYITFRIAGDPAFTNSTFRSLYLYVYDEVGNFGRWGAPVPTSTTNWQIFNAPASSIEKPWDSPGLPNLGNIVQYKFYLYGQDAAPGPEYTATIFIDDVMVRDSALVEFPPPSPMRALIDDFENYADTAAMLGVYSYINSPAATVTTASLETPAPQGNKALKLAIDFAPGQYPWGCVLSAPVAPFSLPANAVVQIRFKGDPSLAQVADDGTTFYLSFLDAADRRINYSTTAAPVISGDWVTMNAPFGAFWTSTTVDTGNLVRWRILVEGWTGSADSIADSGVFYIDDIRITVPPVLTVIKDGPGLSLKMDNLIPGTTYTLRQSTGLPSWTSSTFIATLATQTLPIPAGQKGFYQLYYTP